MKNKKIIIGSRGSKLALIYAERAKSEIMKFAQISGIEEVEIKSITTIGDIYRIRDYLIMVAKDYFLKQLKKNY